MDTISDSSAERIVTEPTAVNADSQSLKIASSAVASPAENEKKEHVQSEMIPQDLLFALTEVNSLLKSKEQELAPVKTLKTPKEMRVALTKGSPDSTWRHRNRRLHFRHLTEPSKSIGKLAGTKDVSFLYDAAAHPKPPLDAPSRFDKSALRFQAIKENLSSGVDQDVPDTMIPGKYHLVKNKAVMGLDYVEGMSSMSAVEREKTLTVFPSVKPTKRFEVVQLIKTMDQMLLRARVDGAENEAKGPTQIRNLLDAIKKEQQICDVVFHEIIRQVAVDCPERGQLLTMLRNRYADLLNRIPRQITSLQAEVKAQRSLDRRLTEELLKFKASIGNLTNELIGVREHDKRITEEAELAQHDLAEALKDSQKNASLVDEYHDLYELQRQRLEGQVELMTREQDMWCNAAYSLALKAISENSLSTAKRLHVTEKAWHKLAGHFNVVIGDNDTESLVQLQHRVEAWRELLFHFHQVLEGEDRVITNTLTSIRDEMKRWSTLFEDKLIKYCEDTDMPTIKLPPKNMVENLQHDIESWEQQLKEGAVRFDGDHLKSNKQQLVKMESEVQNWTDVALTVYDRHRSADTGESHHMGLVMKENNELFEELMKQLETRIAGENGTVKGMNKLLSFLEIWSGRIAGSVLDKEVLDDRDWMKLYDNILEYENMIEETLCCVGSVRTEEKWEEDESIKVEDMISKVQKWLKDTVNEIDEENGKLVDEASAIHTRMVHWMVEMLLHLAPSRGSEACSESDLTATSSLAELSNKCLELSEHLCSTTAYMCQCASPIIESSTQLKRDAGAEDADREERDFARLKSECKEWIRTCQMLLNTLLDEPITLLNEDLLDQGKMVERKKAKDQKGVPAEEAAAKAEEKSLAAKITIKESKKSSPVDEVTAESSTKTEPDSESVETEEKVRPSSLADIKFGVIEVLTPPSSALTQTAYDAITQMDDLQRQLLVTEERAQEAEVKSLQLGEDVNAANETIRALEKELALVEKQLLNVQKEASQRSPESSSVDKPGTPNTPQSPDRTSQPSTPEPGKRGSTKSGSDKKKVKHKKK